MPSLPDPGEQRLVDSIAARSDALVALLCDLIAFDTTSRAAPDSPARDEAALQAFLAERLRGAGAGVEVWEPSREDVAGHPLCPDGGIGFEGRPQLLARFAGSGGGRSLLFNGHIDVVPAAIEDGWEQDPFQARVADGRVSGRGSCDMKGGIAAMVVAAEAIAAAGGVAGDLLVCTNTDEESSGVGGLACARHGVAADFAIVTEPSSLEIWPACRGSVYCSVTVEGRAGHTEQEHASWRDGGAVNAVDKARHLLDGVDALRQEWRSRKLAHHPLLSPPDIVASRFSADAGWPVTIPDRAELTLAVLILPAQASGDGWTGGVREEVEGFLRTWCDADPWLAANPPVFAWHTQVNPSETPVDAASVQALLGANEALGLPPALGGLDSWYDGATYALEAGTPALMYGPRTIDRAHTVGEWVPIEDLVLCAQGLALAAWRLCR